MLTRLLAARKDSSIQLPFDLNNASSQPERGLVLYRPLGIPPGIASRMNGKNAEEIVREWQRDMAASKGHGDSGRFEVVDDDEDLQLDESGPAVDDIAERASNMDVDMDVDM